MAPVLGHFERFVGQNRPLIADVSPVDVHRAPVALFDQARAQRNAFVDPLGAKVMDRTDDSSTVCRVSHAYFRVG
jgi:hypothetical protein